MNVYPIETLDHDKPIFYYPKGFTPGISIKKVAFGTAVIDAVLLPQPQKKDIAVISKAVAEKLRLPETLNKIGLFCDADTLYLAPLIGLFTSNLIDSSEKPAGDRTRFYSKLLDTCSSSGAVGFLFTGNGIDWEHNLIKGYLFAGGKWETRTVPFPNVIYDRLPTRRSENRPEARLAKEKLMKDYMIPWFNPGFFNKFDILNRLKDVPEAQKYMPETLLFTSVDEARRLLDKFGAVYLKPANGTLGMGIRHVIAEFPGSTCYCRFRDKNGKNKLLKFSSLDALISNMFDEAKLKKLLVQQRIILLKVNDRPVDFRVHTNKDGNGQWQVSAIAGKVAGYGSITTHVRSGGDIHTLKELFSEKKSKEVERKLSAAALELSHLLEKKIDGITGEFGFDFGIDRDGIVWLFEVNSKPGRSIFHHSGLRNYEILTRKLTVEYCIYLAEKAVLIPEEIYK
ncbi:YheC/YheD family protein [Neobacillus notoginsengisoli]|uniref:YheC/YheD family endospore coat-associated protein n=1 Tax=Neobacillus notoginsengisoli TaxID=1578198 RepID=UPI001F027F27|nr:YheC/YheD family protein [Neobacillus notoginsengisoli]